MRQISPPTHSDDDPDRHVRCQEALLAAFQDVLAAATHAGWNEREVAVAMIDLADNHILGMAETDNTSAIIALVKRIT
jgi:tryptophan 2,3-dioxygenase